MPSAKSLKMKQAILFFIFMFTLSLTYGGSVSESEAKTVAVYWLNSRGLSGIDLQSIEDVHEHKKNNQTSFYIIRFLQGAWVMVSGTNKVEPVIGYSLHSGFDNDHVPVQLQEWIDGVENEISHAIKYDVHPKIETRQKWERLTSPHGPPVPLKSVSAVGPLLSTRWNQGLYFNELAPEDPISSAGNGHAWVGCVATAMAQVMKYWQYPLTGRGSNSYSSPYGQLSANFANQTYSWSAMPNTVTSEISAVQTLLYHAAVSVNMQFDPYGSGAYLEDAAIALTENFKYNSVHFHSDRDKWDSESDWKQALRNDLDQGKPVLYAGYNLSGSVGHAFVCDGYDGEYFHFNWGWSGSSNGYFMLSLLDPSAKNYSYNQSAIIGLEPVVHQNISTPFSESFESRSSTLSHSGMTSIVSEQRHNGTYSMRLSKPSFSSRSNNVASLTFLAPSNGNISFWVKRVTSEETPNNIQKAILMPEQGSTELINFFEGSYTDADWVNYTASIENYAGQVVRLIFIQQNFDLTHSQYMYIDDVVISGVHENIAPYTPQAPYPSNYAQTVEFNPQLRWSGGDPNGDFVTYSVFFGTSENPPLIGQTQNRNYYSVSDLDYNTTYYWKVAVSDGSLQSISPLWSFTTQGIPPEVSSANARNITSSSAVVAGKIEDTNGKQIESYGICWDTEPNPDITDFISERNGSADSIILTINNLEPYTTYYARPYAASIDGVGYGNDIVFETKPGLPVVILSHVEDVLRTSAKIIGTITHLNDSVVYDKGVVWAEHPDFDVDAANRTFAGFSDSMHTDFEVQMYGLPGPDTVWFKVFAENSVGIAYSDEDFFITLNSAPEINLDYDNSSGITGIHYKGLSVENIDGGFIADSDITITDTDFDTIQQVVLVLKNNVYDIEYEYIYCDSSQPGIEIIDNKTDSVIINNTGNLSNDELEMIVSQIEYRIEHDNPNESYMRKIEVQVSDGYLFSTKAVALMSVMKVNDPPVCIELPGVDKQPVFFDTLYAIPATWVDELDECTGEIQTEYWWQINSDGVIHDIENSENSPLILDSTYCGSQIRIVELVYDSNCGGSNDVTAVAQGEWVTIERASQHLYFEPIPIQPFTYNPLVINAYSTSGLPVTFTTSTDEYVDLVNDSIYMKGIGKTIINAYQNGSSCYKNVGPVFKVLTVEKGHQHINIEPFSEIEFGEQQIIIPRYSSAGLPLDISISDTSVASVLADTLFLKALGTTQISFSQNGNEYVNAAEPVSFEFEVKKGIQNVIAQYDEVIEYSESAIDFSVTLTSGLQPLLVSSDSSVCIVSDGMIVPTGTGVAHIVASHPGNDLYYEIEQAFPIEIVKANQNFTLLVDNEIPYTDSVMSLISFSSLPVNIESSDQAILNVAGNSFQTMNTGQVDIFISNNGNDFYYALDTLIRVEVIKGTQTVNIADTIFAFYHQQQVVLPVETSANLPLVYTADNSILKTGDYGTYSIEGVGEAFVYVQQAGNSMWQSLIDSTVVIIEKGIQTIEHTPLADLYYTSDPVDFTATSISELPVQLVVADTSVVKITDDNLLTVLNAGSTYITATQPGNDYWQGTEIVIPIIVNKASQQIFTTISDTLVVGQVFTYNDFTTSSGLEISQIIISDNNIIQLAGDEFRAINTGPVTLEVIQLGNDNYEEATESFTIELVASLDISLSKNIQCNMHPNPANDIVYFTIDNKHVQSYKIMLLDNQGKQVFVNKYSEPSVSINIRHLSRGVYTFLVYQQENIFSGKLLID